MSKTASCSKHLLNKKIEEIEKAIRSRNSVRAMSIINDLKKEYKNDDDVCEEVSKAMFNILLIDKSVFTTNIFNYIYKSSQLNYFNTELCIPFLGILLLVKTDINEKEIKEIAKRMKNMDVYNLKKMLKKVKHKTIYKEIVEDFQ